MASLAIENLTLTESLFADECEPFFNSIGHKRTNHRGQKTIFGRFGPKATLRLRPTLKDNEAASFGGLISLPQFFGSTCGEE